MTKEEVQLELSIALLEIGKIAPWYEKDVSAWVFEHKAYPVSYAGNSAEEVIQNYPFYLKEFISHRLEGKVNLLIEKKTSGKGGLR